MLVLDSWLHIRPSVAFSVLQGGQKSQNYISHISLVASFHSDDSKRRKLQEIGRWKNERRKAEIVSTVAADRSGALDSYSGNEVPGPAAATGPAGTMAMQWPWERWLQETMSLNTAEASAGKQAPISTWWDRSHSKQQLKQQVIQQPQGNSDLELWIAFIPKGNTSFP